MNRSVFTIIALVFASTLFFPAGPASAQGVTTGTMTGVVADAQGGVIPGATVTAVHDPSGTTYETVTQGDGRFSIPGMRVGGPYTVTVTLTGFETQAKKEQVVSLGVASDIPFTLRVAGIAEQVTVTAVTDPVFSSSRTGAATAVNRMELATLPTISGRIGDITRLTPQAAGQSFAGQDNRLNNITVDGAYFNNSFGLAGQPGDRTGVAPISLEAIEQIQVNVAPYDVRQGNFVGAGVNTVTRSGANAFTASIYHRLQNESFVGTEAKGLAFNPGQFTTRLTGGWAGGPIVKNKLFFFGNFEDELDTRPLSTFRANKGGEPVGGSITRVLESDLTSLSALLSSRFQYDTGRFQDVPDETPGRRFLIRADYNLNNSNKINFKYNSLDSDTAVILSSSGSLGFGRGSGNSTQFLGFERSNYSILENIRSGIGEWNSVIGNSMSNNLIIGYTSNDESRGDIGKLFPFVDILNAGVTYTSFGSEPFTPNNELRYKSFQLQDNFTKFANRHSFTFGGSLERYQSENVFFPGKQSAYVYNSLADFITDANDALPNPNRTTSSINLRRFQVRYSNIPGQEKPIQPLKVMYAGGYVQDEWRPRRNLTISAGLRLDVPIFDNTAYVNANADALTFRDEKGQAVQYSTGKLPDPNVLWSPRVGFNWDVASDQRTQLRGGTGVFTGKPAYVWISNQIGNTGVLTGFISADNTTAFPFSADPNRYKPATVTGAPATSYELALTDANFKFPQVWRSNIALDRRLPGRFTVTGELLYNKDINGIYYINANLPAPQTAFAGVDARPRWTSNRINNVVGNQVSNAIVMKNQNVGSSWNASAMVSKSTAHFNLRSAYSYGISRNTVDPGSIAFGSWAGTPHSGDPNNPGVGYSSTFGSLFGHRVFVNASYSREYFKLGATTVSVFWEARPSGSNQSYVFSGDMNGDGATASDLIYIHRDKSEMNFQPFTVGTRTFTAAEQADAWDAYIAQDEYLSKRRGQYAERGGVFLPLVRRMDLSVMQDLFATVRGKRHSFQLRLDMLNFGNLLNSDWGVGQRLIQNQILTNPAVDAQGRATYRLAVVNNELLRTSLQPTTFIGDVYRFMISLRYTFN
jgi:hypothetical protein